MIEFNNAPQAKIYRVAKINNELNVKYVCPSRTVRSAISRIKDNSERAKTQGRDVRKVGKYYFMRCDNGVIMMLYYCNAQKGWTLPTITKAYEEGVKAFNS